MKFSEFYKLIEAAGWTLSKGKKHHKYVHRLRVLYSGGASSGQGNTDRYFARDDETSRNQEKVA